MSAPAVALLQALALLHAGGGDGGDGAKSGPFNPPIFINNFNRVVLLRRQLRFFRGRGYDNLHVLDNNSTYPPLLRYYRDASAELRRMGVLVVDAPPGQIGTALVNRYLDVARRERI